MAKALEKSRYTSLTEQLSSGEFYLYDPDTITALREKVGERPVVVFNGMNTTYAPAENDPDGIRIPFAEVQETIKTIREQLPDVFIIGWTGKGPRSNVEKAIAEADLTIGESNLQRPQGLSEEHAKTDYLNLVNSADWLTTEQKQDLSNHGPSPSVKDPQLFARGRIVIVDTEKNKGTNKPGQNNSFITFITSDAWAKARTLPVDLVPRISQAIRPAIRPRRQ